MSTETPRYVLVTTDYRTTWCGVLVDRTGETITLKHARMAIYWGTTGGAAQLAVEGPTPRSRIGSVAPVVECTRYQEVIDLTPEAVEAWAKAPTYRQ